MSYPQIIHAAPDGDNAYIVARADGSERVAPAICAALLTDYVLRVAVSISSGVVQITSAFPSLYAHHVEMAIGFGGCPVSDGMSGKDKKETKGDSLPVPLRLKRILRQANRRHVFPPRKQRHLGGGGS